MKLTNNLYFYPEPGMLDCNTYVIKGNPSIIIDPGSPMYLPVLIDNLRRDDIDPEDIGIIANTHLHGDHCGGNEAFKELSGASITIHHVQKEFYDVVVLDAARFFGMPPMGFSEDACLDGDRLSAGSMELELIHSPGHSPDCVCFYCREEKILICGDVIFDRSVGRVDLPGGSADELKQSIEKLSQLEIEYLLPGHMDIVTGAEKVARNFSLVREGILRWL
jgi:glyoxylase-like metal-dependent hydrolase (beta-lactamase superfamily II)